MRNHASPRRWNGKIIGIVAGFVLLRADSLLGALLGLLIGHAVDEGWFADRRDDPYRLLGLTAAASAAEVDLARRRLLAQHHPDRVVGDEPKRQAERRTREVNAAYERIRKRRT
jgi:DnaJ-domain-containing protein 1